MAKEKNKLSVLEKNDITVPAELTGPATKTLEYVADAATKNPIVGQALVQTLARVKASLNYKGAPFKFQQILNADQVFAKIANIAMCKNANPNSVYIVPRSTKETIEHNGNRYPLFTVDVSLNYLAEEHIMLKNSEVFNGIVDVKPIYKEWEFGKDYTFANEELKIIGANDPFREWNIDDIKGVAVVVARKDGGKDTHFVKKKVIVGAIMAKNKFTSNPNAAPKDDLMYGDNSAFNEDMIQKVARRRIYKYYPLSSDLIVNNAFSNIMNSDYEDTLPSNTTYEIQEIEQQEIKMEEKAIDAEVVEFQETVVKEVEIKEQPQQEELPRGPSGAPF